MVPACISLVAAATQPGSESPGADLRIIIPSVPGRKLSTIHWIFPTVFLLLILSLLALVFVQDESKQACNSEFQIIVTYC